MASGLASFNARRNVRAPAITVSTIQGSSISTASITTGTLSLSTLTGSTITSNNISISTLTVSSINSGAPGVAAYSTFNASSINTSSITTSSITTAPGYNSNISNVIYTSLADSGQTAANLITTGMPGTAPTGSVISGSYRLTAGASSGAAVMRLAYTFVVGTTYNFTFTGMQGSQALALYVYQYNSAGTASTQVSASVYSITTSAATVSGSFTPNASGTYTGTIVFYFQALAVNQYVNFTAFSMNTGAMNVGIGTSAPGAILHVSDSTSSASSAPLMLFSPNLSTGGSQYLYFGTANSANNSAQIGWANVGAGSASNYAFLQIFGRANIMTWQASTGNVGIGITNPGAILQVYNGAASYTIPTVSISDGAADNTGTYGMVNLTRPLAPGDNKAHIAMICSGNRVGLLGYLNNTTTMGWVSANSMNSSNGIFLNGSGQVGIGTTNPNNLLTVNGVIQVNDPTSGQKYGLYSDNSVFQLNARSSTGGYIGDGLFLNSSGNVGIGTNPTTKLDVYLTGGASDYWSHFRVKTTSFWGDGCTTRSETAGSQYVTIMPVMLYHPHIVSNDVGDCVIRCGRGGGVTSGRWWDCGTISNNNFRIGLEATNTGINIDTGGKVGINKATPAYTLDVSGNMRVVSGDDSMTYYGPNSTWSSYLVVGSGSTKSGASTAQVISTNGNLHLDAGNGMIIYHGHYANLNGTPNAHYFYGNIYIPNYMSFGSTTYLFPIYVPVGRSYTWYLAYHGHAGGFTAWNQSGTWEVAIWAEKAIVTSYWFGTVSDRRIKKNIQPVGSMLETINKIEIVSFDFIDELNNKRDECGVIAQQIETVFPNAVDTSIGVIPCYQKLATSQHNVGDDVHILFNYDSTDPQQNFKVGDKIKVHAGQKTDTEDKDKGSHHVVVKSIIDGGFITEKWKDYDANDGVFVYGKEVDDFRNVDKEQLGILALKGVQELSSMVSTLQAANAATSSQMVALQQENVELKSQLTNILSRLEALEAR